LSVKRIQSGWARRLYSALHMAVKVAQAAESVMRRRS
jgi:hypothetical protein